MVMPTYEVRNNELAKQYGRMFNFRLHVGIMYSSSNSEKFFNQLGTKRPQSANM